VKLTVKLFLITTIYDLLNMLAPFFGFRGLLDTFDSTAPFVEVRETDKAAILEVEVPRYTADELSVDVDAASGRLTLIGRRGGKPEEDDGFGTLLFVSSPLASFQKTFHFSPKHYDLSQLKSDLKNGVFRVSVPKFPPPAVIAPVTIFGGKASSDAVVAKTTPQELETLRAAKWPPSIRVKETDTAVAYECKLPPTVTQDHLELTLRGQDLVLSINYAREEKTATREEHQSMTYSTSMRVPKGTTPKDIHTELGKDGMLTIQLEKHPNPSQDVKVTTTTTASSADKKN
jgi:HSP20 family molecular chaperone IbpA